MHTACVILSVYFLLVSFVQKNPKNTKKKKKLTTTNASVFDTDSLYLHVAVNQGKFDLSPIITFINSSVL